ncbi:MAG: hypothetical protein IMW89_08905 [Ktedonobacteraceae bacterium]|nr:hypothetical protein [Ktedonobacteraceae bacterium]
MSQGSPSACQWCQAPLAPGQQFCQNCGATNDSNAPVAPTSTAGSSYTPPAPTVTAGPSYTPPAPTVSSTPPSPYTGGQGISSYADPFTPSSAPPPPSYTADAPYSIGNDPYSTPASSPYGPGSVGGYSSPNTNYGPGPAPAYPPYAPAQTGKRSPMLFIVLGVIVVLLGACVASAVFAFNGIKNIASGGSGSTGGTGSGDSGSNVADSQSLNLTFTYSDVQITITSLQQAKKFDDDSLTQYGTKANYVRVNMKEQNQGKRSAYYSYRSSFLLVLPDNTTATAQKAEEYSGPDSGVVRTNWIDFPTNSKVDLSKLTLRVGAQDEVQMDIPLKNGADLSKYQPKKVELNKQTTYAHMSWTLKSATQSYSFQGKQAKKDKVYITVELVGNNNSNYDLYLYGFLRLKSGDSVSSTEYGSNLDNFDTIDAGTTNVQGSATFLVPPSPSGTYTLQFMPSRNFPGQSVDFQI